MEKVILHIDVNNAFLSWSALYLLKNGFKYDIRNRYSVIGGNASKRKGIVLAKSTLAKTKNIVTGDTLYVAKNKCPNLEVYPLNYEFYTKMSKKLFDLLYEYTNEIEIFSIDECFLDYTNIKRRYGNEVKFSYMLKDKIYKELGFTVNIGVANNKLCAKMASDFTKPNRVHTLYNNEIESKMYPLPIDDLFGIGKRTAPKLQQIKINTIGDLANANYTILYRLFKNQASVMINSAKGIDDNPVVYWKTEQKGIGNEITLEEDIIDQEKVHKYLRAIAEHLGLRLRKQNKNASVISVIIKDNKFRRYSHQRKLKNATNVTKEIIDTSIEIFDEMCGYEPIRLIGIRLDSLTNSNSRQLSIFEKEDEHKQLTDLDKVVDELKEKFGSKVIRKASDEDLFKMKLK